MASVDVNKTEEQITEAAVSLVGKLERSTEIKSKAEDFHDVFSCRAHHISNVSPNKVQNCGMHEGEWGTVGSTIVWDYVIDGIKGISKSIIEAIDHENNSTTFRIIEGDIMKLYKADMLAIVQATAKKEGDGSIVVWTMEYEKHHDSTPDPTAWMDFLQDLTIDIDIHLQEVVTAKDAAATPPCVYDKAK